MGIATVIAGAGLAIAAKSASDTNKNQKKMVQAQNEALDYERKQNDLQAARQKRDAIRQARMARAQAESAGANQGVLDSSSVAGGVGSIKSQLGSELSFLDTFNQYSDMASLALGRANVFAQKAQTAAEISKLGMGVYNNADNLAALSQRVFKSG